MGREARMIPEGWQHPVDQRGEYVPLFESGYDDAASEWDIGAAAWEVGFVSTFDGGWKRRPEDTESEHFEDWAGERPRRRDYMPDFPPGTANMIVMYETCSEGTPISPAFRTPEELARWLADTGASAFGSYTANYEAWLEICQGGYAPSVVVVGGALMSGVQAVHEMAAADGDGGKS